MAEVTVVLTMAEPGSHRAVSSPPGGAAWVLALGSILAAWLLSGCGGAPFDGTTYRGDGFAFRVPAAPPRWTPLRHSHAGLAFRDEASRATILLNGRCHVDGEDVPLVALTNHLFMQFTERQIERQEVVPFDGREAMHTELGAKLDGVPMRFDVWVLKKDGCVYDLVYFAPPETAAQGLADFRRVVQGFSATRSDGD
ncbi:MAG: hypothetical protein JRI23_06185 [Deltaproteobacteria bacterium]|jgi:hypothetical protein|nr:hypothetical protein [Deltaproteobacteria bacterium]MBW2531163.1 hypothetical protein [Deltaproteobacteria bacterium]